jgi:hypothetical protein
LDGLPDDPHSPTLSLVAFVLATGRRLMSHAVYRGILLMCGLFLLVLAAWFIDSGIDFLR